MSWSYVGLVAAGAAEFMTRSVTVDFGATVAVTSLAVVLVGWILVNRGVPKALGRASYSARQSSR